MADFIEIVRFLEVPQEPEKEVVRVEEKFMPGFAYGIKGEDCDDFIMPERIYRVIKILKSVYDVPLNAVIVKQVYGPVSTTWSLTRTDCKRLGINYAKGLQIFPINMPWIRHHEYDGSVDEYIKVVEEGPHELTFEERIVMNVPQNKHCEVSTQTSNAFIVRTDKGNRIEVHLTPNGKLNWAQFDDINWTKENEKQIRLKVGDTYYYDLLGINDFNPITYDKVLLRLNGFKYTNSSGEYISNVLNPDNYESNIINESVFAETLKIDLCNKSSRQKTSCNFEFIKRSNYANLNLFNDISFNYRHDDDIVNICDDAIYIIVNLPRCMTLDTLLTMCDTLRETRAYDEYAKKHSLMKLFSNYFSITFSNRALTGKTVSH